MIIRKGKKGFSLIELLAVITIMGIIMSMSIVAYTKYKDKAKEEYDRNNEKVIISATKSFLESNPDMKPKIIGDNTKVQLKTLKQKNYLKNEIKDSKGKSCMDSSYVYVYKYEYNKYSYKGFLYCGNNEDQNEQQIPTPTVGNISFSNMNDVNDASFSMQLHGSSDNSIAIQSFQYTISIEGDNIQKQTYASEVINANKSKTIDLNNVKISQYLNLTDTTKVVVSVYVKNILGGVYTESKTYTYKDNKKPICEKIEGQASGDNDWLNKKDIDDGKTRKISVSCNDGNGSGCLRSKFNKSFPNNNNESIINTNIEIRDNAGNKQDCQVLVNIDVDLPIIKVDAYNKNNVLTASVNTNKKEKESILENAYSDRVNNWLNLSNYNGRVVYKVNVSDNYNLDRYTWETNQTLLPSGTSNYNIKKNLNGPETKSAVIPESKYFEIEFNNEGMRYGKLTVYDKAGNSTIVEIYANIDKTPPERPTITLNNYISKADPSVGDTYTTNKWTNLPVISRIVGGKVDVNNLSGWDKYEYQFKNIGNNYSSTTKGERKDFTTEGNYSVKYRSCDKAGNCSDYTERNNIKIDMTAPDCEHSGESTNWQNYSRSIELKCKDKGTYKSECIKSLWKTDVFKKTTKQGTTSRYVIEDNAGNKTTCEPKNVNVYVDIDSPTCKVFDDSVTDWVKGTRTIEYGCVEDENNQSGCQSKIVGSKTFTGTTKIGTIDRIYISDKVGNTTECLNASAKVYLDNTAPTCGTATNASKTWTSSDRTIKQACKDAGESGCEKTSYDKTYSSTKKTDTITIKDKVGNTNKCTYNVYVDKTGPTITWSTENDGYTLIANVKDNESGLSQYHWKTDADWVNTGSKTSFKHNYSVSKDTEETKKRAFYIKDKVGNVNHSSYEIYKDCTKKVVDAKKGNPFSDSDGFDKYVDKISNPNPTPTLFSNIAFHWKFQKLHCINTNGKSGVIAGSENRAYYILKEVGCVCQKDKHSSAYCNSKAYNVAKKTHGDTQQAFIVYNANCSSRRDDNSVINAYVSQVCNNGTSFETVTANGASVKVLTFHGYKFYSTNNDAMPSSMKIKFKDLKSNGIWTAKNKTYDGSKSNAAMCKVLCGG